MKEYYLDNAATTALCEESKQAMIAAMEEYGNPSSTHKRGRTAAELLMVSRKKVSDAIGASDPSEIVFTSCGSESDNWALLRGADLLKHQGKHIISSVVEHDAIRKTLDELEKQGYTVTRLQPDKTGRIPVSSVGEALREDTILISLMMVNNETGAVTDIPGIAKMLKERKSKALLHTDAVQAFMKVDFRADKLGADLISISAHKIHGPKGIGALYIRNGVKLKPFLVGGSQENGLRAGTENLILCAGFAAAAEKARQEKAEYLPRLSAYKKEIVERLQKEIPGLFSLDTEAPHILSIALPGFRSEVIMNFLEAKNIYVSKSSACKRGARSHVLTAIGMSAREIDGAIRIGLSRLTAPEDIDALINGIVEAYRFLAHR